MKEGKPSGKCMVARAGYRLRSRVDLGTRMCMALMLRGQGLGDGEVQGLLHLAAIPGPQRHAVQGGIWRGGRMQRGLQQRLRAVCHRSI